jgi:hypothetical protein
MIGDERMTEGTLGAEKETAAGAPAPPPLA